MTIGVLTRTDEALHKTAEAQQKSTEIADRIREITEAGTRALVGPQTLRIDGSVSVDQPLKLIVDYHNTGRSPATDFFYDLRPKIFTIDEDASGELGRDSDEYMSE